MLFRSPDLVPLALPPAAPIQFWITYTERVRRSPAGMVALDWLLSIFNSSDYPHFGDDFVHPDHVPPSKSQAPAPALSGVIPQLT